MERQLNVKPLVWTFVCCVAVFASAQEAAQRSQQNVPVTPEGTKQDVPVTPEGTRPPAEVTPSHPLNSPRAQPKREESETTGNAPQSKPSNKPSDDNNARGQRK